MDKFCYDILKTAVYFPFDKKSSLSVLPQVLNQITASQTNTEFHLNPLKEQKSKLKGRKVSVFKVSRRTKKSLDL